jgi:hypothetical protein
MNEKQLRLRHELYDILTNPNTLYLATKDHLIELAHASANGNMLTSDTMIIRALVQASNEYLAGEYK